MAQKKKQTMLNGAFVLVASTIIVKLIGALYKIPLTGLIGEVGRGYFNTAYEIYTPLYAISMAGLPIAVSRMVSQETALGRYRDARMIFRVARRLFFITGIIGTALMFLIAYPYTNWVIESPSNLVSLLAIAPSIFFCCCMSTYRGYYEGLTNMVPTALSQVIEAMCKLVVGLGFAKLVMTIGLNQFEATGVVFGHNAPDMASALSAIYPYSAAAAVCGVTSGTVVGFIYLSIRHKLKGDGIERVDLINSPKPRSSQQIAKTLISTAIPMALSSLILNITNLIDSVTIRSRLAYCVENSLEIIKEMYSTQLINSQTIDKDIGTYLYGVYSTVLDFKNLVPTITLSLGISAIPIISAAWATKDRKTTKITIESVLRITMLIALPVGIGMAVLSEPILSLVYSGSKGENLISIAAPILTTYGFAIFLFAMSTPITNMLQAIGRTDIPLKSLVVGAVVKIILNYILVGNAHLNINGAPIGSIVCYIIMVCINLISLIRISKVKLNFVSIFGKPLLCSAVCGVVAYTSHGLIEKLFVSINFVSHAGSIATILAVALAGIAYVISLLVFKGISADDVKMIPKGEKIQKSLEKYGFLG